MSDIHIRHSEPDDAIAIADIFAQPKVISGTLQQPYPSVEFGKKRLTLRPGITQLVAEIKGRVVGVLTFGVGQNPRRKHAGEIGMAVHDDFHGQGVGSALMTAIVDMAENWLNVSRIELSVFTDNAAGIALYEKFGFETEGTLRNYAFRNGTYADVYAMARLRTK